jgi:hypothetical protein
MYVEVYVCYHILTRLCPNHATRTHGNKQVQDLLQLQYEHNRKIFCNKINITSELKNGQQQIYEYFKKF